VAKPDPAFLFNIGQCYRKLGKKNRPSISFRRFLKRAAPDDPNRAQVEARLRDTETDAVFKGDLQRAEEREEAETPPPAEPTVAATPAPVVVELPTPPAPPLPRRTPVFRQAGCAGHPATEASHRAAACASPASSPGPWA